MRIIADLQIHSKYARATSKDLSFDKLERYARIKGIDVLGVGDFQHPLQYKAIKSELKEDDNGILRTKSGFPFIWQTEVSLMYSDRGRRAIHLLLYAPNGDVANKIITYLSRKGRLDYDGRPIFGITCPDIVRDLKDIDKRIEIIPAHCLTPFFGLFGSKSGFDSLEECFKDQTGEIHAVESGMSADPAMIGRFNDTINVVSFSDAHSFWPWRIGREATIFDADELSYENIISAIRTGRGLDGTIETYPEYGKYHYDGHRSCKFTCAPAQTKMLGGVCPVCKKPLTIGVEYRIEELARHEAGYAPKNAKPFYRLLPLHELISFAIGSPLASKKTWALYNGIIEKFGNEFDVLLNRNPGELHEAKLDAALVDIIMLSRLGKLRIRPGYDGEYGTIEMEKSTHADGGPKGQKTL